MSAAADSVRIMSSDQEIGFPRGTANSGAADERELLLSWLGDLRGAVIRKVDGVSEDGARWTPQGRLIPLLGVVVHLTGVEWRWIDGGMARPGSDGRGGPLFWLAAPAVRPVGS
jgi:hypothetical protein